MAGKRLIYLAVLLLCSLFYIAYGQWLAYLVLVTVLALPWFSLLLSLPAIFRFQAVPGGPAVLNMEESGELWLTGSCDYPMPPFRGSLRLRRCITGESWHYLQRQDLPTNHCGGIAVAAQSVKICDYLGLFAFPVRCREEKIILIRPRPIPFRLQQDPQKRIVASWKPKFGGGYAENHELRLYRPGDSINQIHWKLSAKTGNLMLRQPLEPRRGTVLVTMNLRGSPEEMDLKFGRLLWLGSHLLKQIIPFELQVLTGSGIATFSVAEGSGLQKAIDCLLCQSAALEGDLRDRKLTASWHYHIGGEPDEA